MSRPTGRDESVIKRAAELSLEEFRAWVADPSLADEILLRDLSDAIRWGFEGYERAKHLEAKGYSPDGALVELLDGVDVWGAEREAVAAWVKQFDVKPPFPVGTIVTYEDTTGEVIKHDDLHGLATVCVASKGHVKDGMGTHGYLIAWEKLQTGPVDRKDV